MENKENDLMVIVPLRQIWSAILATALVFMGYFFLKFWIWDNFKKIFDKNSIQNISDIPEAMAVIIFGYAFIGTFICLLVNIPKKIKGSEELGLIKGLIGGLTVGLAGGLIYGVVFGLICNFIGKPYGFPGAFIIGFVTLFIVGLLAGTIIGLKNELSKNPPNRMRS